MQHTQAHWRVLLAGVAALLLVGAGCGGGGTGTPAPSGETKQEEKAAASPGQKTELTGATVKAMYFDAETEVAVKNVTLNFLPADGTPPDDGKQYVRVELSITNIGKKSFSVNPVNYRLKTSAPELEGYTFILESAMPDFLPDKEIQPGESVTGALPYEVSTSETLDTMSLVYEGAVSKEGSTDRKDYAILFKK